MANIQPNITKSEMRAIQGSSKIMLFVLLFVTMPGIFSACAPNTNLLGSGSWQASSLSRQHIHALVVNPNMPQTLYAGDEDGTIFSSSDAGQHWTKQESVSPTPILLSLLAMPSSGKTLYALTNVGLFTSTDIAQTWHIVDMPGSGLPTDSYTAFVFGEQKNIYVGTLHHGIFMSNDATHWKAMNTTLPQEITINELAYDSSQHRLWAATSLGVYRSDNAGTTWDALNDGLSIPDGVTSIQSAASAGGPVGLVYAGTRHGIFRSTDSGSHWSESGQVLQGVPIQQILVDFRSTNASTVYVGTKFGAFRSDDSGQNWSGIATGLPHNTIVYTFAIGANKASQLFIAANNVYLYPGNSSLVNPTRVITLFLILVLFLLLAWIAQRGTKRRKAFLHLMPNNVVSSVKKN